MDFDRIRIPTSDLDQAVISLDDIFSIEITKSLTDNVKCYWRIVSSHHPQMSVSGVFDSWVTMQETLCTTLAEQWGKFYSWQLRTASEYYEETYINADEVMSYLNSISKLIRSKIESNETFQMQKRKAASVLLEPIQSAHINMFLYKTYLNNDQFWDSYSRYRNRPLSDIRPEWFKLDDNHKRSFQGAIIVNFKISLLHGIYSCVESIFRAIQRTVNNHPLPLFYDVYTSVLNQVELDKSDRKDVLSIANYTRNTFHNNGVFWPTSKYRPPNKYRGVELKFIEGEALEFASVYFILDIVSDLVNICMDILNSNKVNLDELKLPNQNR